MKTPDHPRAGAAGDARARRGDSSESEGELGGSARPPGDEAGALGDEGTNGAWLQGVFPALAEIVAAASRLLDVRADRLRLSLRRRLVRSAIGAGAAVAAVLWLGAATLATLRGICGGLTTLWGGREWLGQLSGGLLALLLAAGSVALVLNLSSRRELRRLRAKYGRTHDGHGEDDDAATETGDGGGAPGSSGSGGAPRDHRPAAAGGG